MHYAVFGAFKASHFFGEHTVLLSIKWPLITCCLIIGSELSHWGFAAQLSNLGGLMARAFEQEYLSHFFPIEKAKNGDLM